METVPAARYSEELRAQVDPMAQLMCQEATSTDTTDNVTGDGFSLGGEVALGLKLGGGFTMANSEQRPVRGRVDLPGAAPLLRGRRDCVRVTW